MAGPNFQYKQRSWTPLTPDNGDPIFASEYVSSGDMFSHPAGGASTPEKIVYGGSSLSNTRFWRMEDDSINAPGGGVLTLGFQYRIPSNAMPGAGCYVSPVFLLTTLGPLPDPAEIRIGYRSLVEGEDESHVPQDGGGVAISVPVIAGVTPHCYFATEGFLPSVPPLQWEPDRLASFSIWREAGAGKNTDDALIIGLHLRFQIV
jgi:hypothetical protein